VVPNHLTTYSNLLVRKGYKTQDGHSLSNWVGTQRKEYKKGKLDAERIQRLEELGFVWDPFAENFENYFAALVKYKEEFGHLRVAAPHKTHDGLALGAWVGSLRQNYKQGKLDAERIRRLDEIGFLWEPSEKTTS